LSYTDFSPRHISRLPRTPATRQRLRHYLAGRVLKPSAFRSLSRKFGEPSTNAVARHQRRMGTNLAPVKQIAFISISARTTTVEALVGMIIFTSRTLTRKRRRQVRASRFTMRVIVVSEHAELICHGDNTSLRWRTNDRRIYHGSLLNERI